jgi:hypothetical protein
MTRIIYCLIDLWNSDFSTFTSFIVFLPMIGGTLALAFGMMIMILNMLTGTSFSILFLLIFFGIGIGVGIVFGLFVGGIIELSKLF